MKVPHDNQRNDPDDYNSGYGGPAWAGEFP